MITKHSLIHYIASASVDPSADILGLAPGYPYAAGYDADTVATFASREEAFKVLGAHRARVYQQSAPQDRPHHYNVSIDEYGILTEEFENDDDDYPDHEGYTPCAWPETLTINGETFCLRGEEYHRG